MLHSRGFAVVLLTGSLLALSNGIAGAATQALRADLATDPGTEQILQVPTGDYTVLIANKAPQNAYNVQVEVSFTPIPPLTAPGSLHTATRNNNDPCAQLENDAATIRASKDEKEVAQLVADIQNILKTTSCKDSTQVIAETLQSVDAIVYTLGNGQDLKVTVRDTASTPRTWTFIFRTPGPGSWFSSYGFVFIPNRDQRYFSMLKAGTTDKYLVTRARDNSGSDFSPSLFYSWLPANRENRALSFGATAGLGFDQSNPIVFLGPMLTYHQNVSLVAGVVIHKQKRLNGMYVRNQEVGENLSDTQLTEQTYKPNFFFGLSFRFGANPFTAPAADSKPVQKTAGKTPDTPKDTPK